MSVGLPPFQRLLDAYAEDVYGFLSATVGATDADDCFQETFLAALRAYPRLRHADNLRSWLLTIAHRKAIDAHRARDRRAVPVAEVPERPAKPPRDVDPELWSAVRVLPPKQRAAVAHRFVNDLPYRDIAVVMSCSEDAARQSVRAGLATLRERGLR